LQHITINVDVLLSNINVKKLQFIHKLTASDTSRTAKITKKGDIYYPPAHRLNVNVLLSNITYFVIFAVLDVSLAVNLCINCSFLHLYLQFYYISELLAYSKTAFLDCLHKIIIRQFLVFST